MYKVQTKEEALATVNIDGARLKEMPFEYRDDIDIVCAAIRHGAFLEYASYRMQNDVKVIMTYAEQVNTGHYKGLERTDFAYALFVAKNDKEQVFAFSKAFLRQREFMINLKMHFGNEMVSPFAEYDSMNSDELNAELDKIILSKILDAKKRFYEYIPGVGQIHHATEDHEFGSLLFGIESYNINHLPFAHVLSILEEQKDRLDNEKEVFCSVMRKGSFPEQFVDSFLITLNVEHLREVVFPWSHGKDPFNRTGQKRYDFYLPEVNTIIEVHGSQHYMQGFESVGGRTLEEEQSNDQFKKQLALTNGIDHYIVIDARKSKVEFIKQSILENKELLEVLNNPCIDWNTVKKGMVLERDVYPTPIHDIRTQRLERYIKVLRCNLDERDYKPRVFVKKSPESNRKKSITGKKTKNNKKETMSALEIVQHGYYDTQTACMNKAKNAQKTGDIKTAIIYFTKCAFVELCGEIYDGDDEIKRKFKERDAFPYATSNCRVERYTIRQINRCKEAAQIGEDELEDIIRSAVCSSKYKWLRWHMFTREECVQIIVNEIKDIPANLDKIYEDARIRIQNSGYALINPNALNLVKPVKKSGSDTPSKRPNTKHQTSSSPWKFSKDSDGSLVIRKYEGDSATVSIPAEIGGHRVGAIKNKAFYGNTTIREITLPPDIREIGEQAFSGCTGLADENGFIIVRNTLYGYTGALKHVVIPNSVIKIESFAFHGCAQVECIEIPNSVKDIGSSAFEECCNLRRVLLSTTLQSLPERIFSKCVNLEKINIPLSIESIGTRAFCNCGKLTDISFTENLVSIGERAFYGCKSMTFTALPTNLHYAGPSAFSNCSMPCHIEIPETMSEIAESMFDSALNIESVHMPDSIINIGKSAFARCKQLQQINFSPKVNIIRAGTFLGCSSLQSMVLPESILEVGTDAFARCSNLNKLTVLGRYTVFKYEPFEYTKNVVIWAYSDSFAKKYAELHNISFQELQSII